MATILRPPLILRIEPKDKAGVANRAQDDVSSVNTLQSTLKGQDRIHRGPGQTTTYDYPNPQPPKPRSIALYSHIYLALALTVAPFVQTDWPVPKAPTPINRGFTDKGNALTATTVLLSPTYPASREPTFTKTIIASSYSSPQVLIAVTAAPFVQTDWSNPRGPVVQNYLRRTWTQSGLALSISTILGPVGTEVYGPTFSRTIISASYSSPCCLTQVQAPPFVQTDWPNPRGYQPLNRGWTDSFKLPLTTVVGFNQDDWPNPRGYPPLNLGFTYGLDQETLIVSLAAQPFSQDDWPVPPAARRLSGLSWTDSFKLTLTTVAPPFLQTDYPNPRGYARCIDLWTWTQTGYLEEVGEPFRQVDWPLPRGYQPLNRGWSDSFKLPLTTVVGFNQTDWPVPKGYAPTLWRGWIDSFKLPLTTVVGFNQTDWPNPRGAYTRSLDLLTWLQTGYLEEVGEPFRQSEWPVPKGAARLTALSWTDSFKLPLQTIVPFNQYGWVVPPPPPRGTKDAVLGPNQNLLLTAVPGTIDNLLKPKDWPNPRGYAPLNRGWIWESSLNQLTFVNTKPITQLNYDWPNPRGHLRKYGHLRLSFTDRNSLNLSTVSPQQPIAGLKFFKWSLSFPTTGPNVVVSYVFPIPPPPPPPVVPPKAKHVLTGISSGKELTQIRGGKASAQVTGGKGKTQVTGGTEFVTLTTGKALTDVSDP